MNHLYLKSNKNIYRYYQYIIKLNNHLRLSLDRLIFLLCQNNNKDLLRKIAKKNSYSKFNIKNSKYPDEQLL